MWLEIEGCRVIAESAWRLLASGRPMHRVEEKIKIYQAKLSRWSRVAFGNITRALTEKKNQLKHAKERGTAGWSNG